jgi:hypothetical protein
MMPGKRHLHTPADLTCSTILSVPYGPRRLQLYMASQFHRVSPWWRLRLVSRGLECLLVVVPASFGSCDRADASEMTLSIAELFIVKVLVEEKTPHHRQLHRASLRRLRWASHRLECPLMVVPAALAGCDRADASEMTLPRGDCDDLTWPFTYSPVS